MHFSLSEIEQMIVASVAELCAKSIGADAAEWDDAGRLPDALWAEVGALGLMGMSAPEDVGGVGISAVGRAAVLQALAAGDAAVALRVAMHDGLATAHVLRAGTPAQRTAWLPDAVAGLVSSSWCAAGPDLRAERSGQGWVLHGQTPVTVGVTAAQRMVINVEVPQGVASCLVDAAQAGVSTVAVDRLGVRASAAGRVHLDGVVIGESAVLGLPGDGLAAALAAEHWVALAAIACGVGRAALRAATAYAQQREQFGEAIANFQAIQWKLANAATTLDAAALMTARAALRIDQGALDPAAAAGAKTLATTAAERACSDALQIHGGYGYTREFAVERYLRAAKTLAIEAGTNRASRRATAAAIVRRVADR